jgi:hypothetical protein
MILIKNLIFHWFLIQHPLLPQCPAHHNGKKNQLTERYNGQPIGIMHAKNIGKFSLDRWNYGATEDQKKKPWAIQDFSHFEKLN